MHGGGERRDLEQVLTTGEGLHADRSGCVELNGNPAVVLRAQKSARRHGVAPVTILRALRGVSLRAGIGVQDSAFVEGFGA